MSTTRLRWGYYDTKMTDLTVVEKCCPCSKQVPFFWKINWAAALLHLANTVATLILWAISEDQDQTFQLAENYAPWINITDMNESTFVNGCPVSDANRIFRISDEFCVERRTAYTSELSLWWLVIVFHFLSFAFQTLAMADWTFKCCGKTCTRKNLVNEVDDDGTNVLRMIEYSVSATLMQIAIALILGIWDRLLIGAVAALTVVTMLCGLIAEQLASDKLGLAWVAHATGWLAMGAVWTILGRQFGFTIEKATEQATATPPEFVYAIVIVIGVLYTGFGFIQGVQLCSKKSDRVVCCPSDRRCTCSTTRNRAVELAYCFMSLTSKTFLGWIIFASALGGMAQS